MTAFEYDSPTKKKFRDKQYEMNSRVVNQRRRSRMPRTPLWKAPHAMIALYPILARQLANRIITPTALMASNRPRFAIAPQAKNTRAHIAPVYTPPLWRNLSNKSRSTDRRRSRKS